jgi:inner membrane protein
MGGRLRTGGAGEYGVAWVVVGVCWLAVGQIGTKGGGYLPFFPDWAGRYDAGTATAKEWRENRLRFF